MIETSDGTLLGGRVRHRQPASGFRSGIEPVMLAAAIPARPGQRVLEAGSGAGATLLCLASRTPDVTGVGAEIDPELVAAARRNAAANGFDHLSFIEADVTALPAEIGLFDHACANPPYHVGGTPSPDAMRERAKRASSETIGVWISKMAACLAPRGTITLAVPASALDQVLRGFGAASCGSALVHPLWPRAGAAAKLVIARAVKGGKGPCVLSAGLALHEPDGTFTPQAQAILRDGAALPLHS